MAAAHECTFDRHALNPSSADPSNGASHDEDVASDDLALRARPGAQLKAWLEKMIAALQFAQLVVAVLALVGKMRDLSTELVKQLTHLRRARPRSESLERLERQLVLPLEEGVAVKAAPKIDETAMGDEKNAVRSKRGRCGGRAALPHTSSACKSSIPSPPRRGSARSAAPR
jgi:hypothetical protein